MQTTWQEKRKAQTRLRVSEAISKLSASGLSFTVLNVAQEAGISESLLYTSAYKDLRTQAHTAIERAKTRAAIVASTNNQCDAAVAAVGHRTIAKLSGRFYRVLVANGTTTIVEPIAVTNRENMEFYQQLADYAQRNGEAA